MNGTTNNNGLDLNANYYDVYNQWYKELNSKAFSVDEINVWGNNDHYTDHSLILPVLMQ